jgi:hypothetical protein
VYKVDIIIPSQIKLLVGNTVGFELPFFRARGIFALTSSRRKGRKPFGLWVRAGHYSLTHDGSLVSFAAVASVPRTTRNAGFPAFRVPGGPGLRGASVAAFAAVVASSPTKRT